MREQQHGWCEHGEGVTAVASGGGGRDEVDDNGWVEEKEERWVCRF